MVLLQRSVNLLCLLHKKLLLKEFQRTENIFAYAVCGENPQFQLFMSSLMFRWQDFLGQGLRGSCYILSKIMKLYGEWLNACVKYLSVNTF